MVNTKQVKAYTKEELDKVLHYLEGPLRMALKENVAVVDKANLKEGDRILDIGCGSGFLSLEAAKRVGVTGKVISLDLRQEMLDVLKSKAKKNGMYDRIETICSSAERIAFEDEQFDAVVMSYLLHENPDSVNCIMKEAVRVLKKGGKIVTSDFIKVKDEERNKEIEEWHKSTDPESEKDEVHFVYTIKDFEAFFIASGLQNISSSIWYDFHGIVVGEKGEK